MNLLACFFIWITLARAAISPDSTPDTIRISPETTNIAAPLTFDGSRLDYGGFLNMKHSFGVVPESNSAVLYMRAVGKQNDISDTYCRDLELLLGTRLFENRETRLTSEWEFIEQKIESKEIRDAQEFFDMQSASTQGPWRERDFPLVAEWLKVNERSLELVEEAGKLPHYYMPLVPSQMLINSPLSFVQYYRRFIYMLDCRVMLRVGEGDFEGTSRDLITMYRMAWKTGQGSTVIEGLVACAMYAISEHALQSVITSTAISAERLELLQRELSRLPEVCSIHKLVGESERYVVLDALQHASRNDPRRMLREFDVTFNAGGADNVLYEKIMRLMYESLMASGIDWNVSLIEANRCYDEYLVVLTLPTYAERNAALDSLNSRVGKMKEEACSFWHTVLSFLIPRVDDYQVSRMMVSSLLFGLNQLHEAWTRGEVRRRVSPLGCAIERFRRVNGIYPPDLASLIPSFIEELPLDPYTDKPFHYRVNGDRSQFAVFTFGPNEIDERGATWGEGGDDMGMHSPGWLATTLKP